ncbi:MAG: transglutaminase family protein, partial [Verrucomicrobiota bacterium]
SEVFRFLKSPITRDAVQASEFVFPTYLTKPTPEITAFAQHFFAPEKSYLACVIDLNNAIYSRFEFDPEATDINTPLDQFYRQNRGVCQDFAHFMIACLRSQGYSAGYTSGYLLTHPPDGEKRLEGADASHAWVTVHIPDIGWLDFDPTNALVVNQEHIHVARGRDYQDIAPIKGAMSGGGEQKIDIEVTVHPEWELASSDDEHWF